jgi:hypothetical protein
VTAPGAVALDQVSVARRVHDGALAVVEELEADTVAYEATSTKKFPAALRERVVGI